MVGVGRYVVDTVLEKRTFKSLNDNWILKPCGNRRNNASIVGCFAEVG